MTPKCHLGLKLVMVWITSHGSILGGKVSDTHGKKFDRHAALPLMLLRHYIGGRLQRSL